MNTQHLLSILSQHVEEFQPVVPFTFGKDRLLAMDLSEKNTELTDEIFQNTGRFTTWVNEQLAGAGARYGIGGYGEFRTVYQFSKVFDAGDPTEEPRRFHLGTDIWGRPHTAVMAPVTGLVHSYGFNNAAGDYGTTIILSHNIDGTSFYTLYGHLGLNSIKNIQEGMRIQAGEVFADFGIPAENGQWPPHLHFQLIQDIGQWKGDYPGVCRFSEKDAWLENSPDPDLLLQMNRYLF
jgi:murein DD-endopeptidase MepM/ murein hydrolase activator NlpD